MSLRLVLSVYGGLLIISSSFAAAPVENVVAGVTPVTSQEYSYSSGVSQASMQTGADVPPSQSNNDIHISTKQELAPALTVEQQLTKINNQMSLLLPVRSQLQYLQQRVDRLQGELDEKNYKISELKKELQAMFNNMDSRMLVLEGSAVKPQSQEASSAMAHGQTVSAAEIDGHHGQNQGAAAINAKERYAYQAAYQLLSERKYSDAVEAFERFLKLYPKGPYTVSAYFWLGEIYIIEGMPDKAMVALRKIIKSYPHSDKAPSAAYHLGTIYVANGDAEHAKEMFMKVVKEFPDTKSARLAKEQLKQLSS
ncbi:tol-pal system protein YbgF [Piscirickettsia salmonis]|uniref:tol-pal system protein YbgF n=1 Tax=Piscirickettsia salmonis TaxID=1238 RepID=UPI000F095C7F|nr:tol-pal system protein YbgF [Piscirickettsiaceae bacterium NZ-RLO2]